MIAVSTPPLRRPACTRPPQRPDRLPVLRRAAVALLVLTLAACASRTPAPVEERAGRPAAPPGTPSTAAAARPAAEPDWRPSTYTVKRGDTLYAIALDHGLDYRDLAAWNNIENLNLIRVGQVLRLAAPGEPSPAGAANGVATAPLRTPPPVVPADDRPGAPAVAGAAAGATASSPGAAAAGRGAEGLKTQPKLVKEPYSEQALREAQRAAVAPEPPPVVARAEPTPAEPRPAPSAGATTPPAAETKPAPADDASEKIDWVWPTAGKVIAGFSETANLKGIDIAGKAGQAVVASAPGKVVYAGTGLRGYGKLIIVKHNATYLSAYAHNREILVKEGQAVTRGQKIAEMGDTDASGVKLHFEIRRLGKPMDPLRYLPPA